MRTSAALLLLALLVLAAPSASAQAPAAGAPQRHYYITPGEMLEVYGTYRLSNGEILRITREKRRYWAEMPSTGKVEIVPVDSIVFVSRDGNMRLEFRPLAFATDVNIRYAPGAGPAASLDGRSTRRAIADEAGN